MEQQITYSAEQMLEDIFLYMSQLVDEKDFSKVVSLLTDLGRVLAHSERASFWYWDAKHKQYWTLAAVGSDKITVPEGSGIIDASIQNKETIVINDPYQDERFNPAVDKQTGFVTKSILCMPVTNAKGKVIGAYQAINKLNADGTTGTFDEKDKKHLTLAAVYCGKTLESYLLDTEIRIDPLTGLTNRRGFYEFYEETVSDPQNGTASIIMCDIDFFKKVNDTDGHNAGDAVLQRIAVVLQEHVASEDEAVRWGGEEFILMCMDCPLVKAQEIAEHIREIVEHMSIEFEEHHIAVTMSFGVYQLDGDQTMDQNVKQADERLYQAKTTGRNRVVV